MSRGAAQRRRAARRRPRGGLQHHAWRRRLRARRARGAKQGRGACPGREACSGARRPALSSPLPASTLQGGAWAAAGPGHRRSHPAAACIAAYEHIHTHIFRLTHSASATRPAGGCSAPPRRRIRNLHSMPTLLACRRRGAAAPRRAPRRLDRPARAAPLAAFVASRRDIMPRRAPHLPTQQHTQHHTQQHTRTDRGACRRPANPPDQRPKPCHHITGSDRK